MIILDDEIVLGISAEEVIPEKVAVLPRAIRILEVYVEPRLILGGMGAGG